jgi:hypothetical protein
VLAQAGVSDCPCEDVSWVWNSDFANSANIWTPMDDGYGGQATYSAGWASVDIQTEANPTYMRIIQITTPTFTPTRITKVIATYDLTKGSWQAQYGATAQVLFNVILDDDTILFEGIFNADAINGDGQTLEFEFDEPDVKRIWFSVRGSARQTPAYSGIVGLPSIEVHGSGFNPFI